MFRNQVVRQETAKGGLSYVFLGWLFKLVFKNQLDIHIKKYFSKILQKCKKCNKGLLKYLMIILGESGGYVFTGLFGRALDGMGAPVPSCARQSLKNSKYLEMVWARPYHIVPEEKKFQCSLWQKIF